MTENIFRNATDIFLNEIQLSARWKTSRRTLQQARWKGYGCPYTKIGRLVRYRISDIEAYENARTQLAPSNQNVEG